MAKTLTKNKEIKVKEKWRTNDIIVEAVLTFIFIIISILILYPITIFFL